MQSNFNANPIHSPPQQQQQQQDALTLYAPQATPHHTMPTPSAAPWNLDSMPWQLASPQTGSTQVMQFNARPFSMETRRSLLHQKRKSELVPELPPKQFISEEKITAHFNGLHISTDYIHTGASGSSGGGAIVVTPPPPASSVENLGGPPAYSDYQVTARELEEKLRKANRITMCDEIRKLHEEQRMSAFLPEALLNRIEKPCTALVLWQPPPMLELLQRKQQEEGAGKDNRANDDEYFDEEPEAEMDDFLNNNTCTMDFNNIRVDSMDEDF